MLTPISLEGMPEFITDRLYRYSSSMRRLARAGLSLLEEHSDNKPEQNCGWLIDSKKQDVQILVCRKEKERNGHYYN